MDYLYMGQAEGKEFKYILLLRDDSSSYVWLWPSDSASGECAADVSSMWISTFGSVDWVVTDQGTHFTNTLLQNIAHSLNLSHHFKTAYCS